MPADHNPIDADYAILHDEDFDAPFRQPRLGAEAWLFTGGRSATSLDGDWAFALDLHFNGLRSKWFRMEPLDPAARTFPYDWDPYAADTTPVPSNWQMTDPRAHYFEGAGWYARTLDGARFAPGRRHFLRIGAAAYACRVFLNGTFLGVHQGASTPFAVELTDHLRPGPNQLMLCVDNVRILDRVPMRHTDWFNYGGIYREVELYDTPPTLIRDLFVHLVPDGRFDTIRLRAEIDGPAEQVQLSIPGLGIAAEVPVRDGVAEASFAARPELWSPESPVLYDVALSCGADRVTDRIGFREIRRAGTEILLNGKPLFLRGVSVHEDDAVLGRVCTQADLRRRFADARDLGCNFLRLAHYPHHEAAARMADEQGLLLWEEVPVYWAINFANPATLQDAENQLAELVRRDRNRASVIIWSVGNENPDTDLRLAFMSRLARLARALDPSRLVSAACLVNHRALRIEDRLAEVVDVIGLNEYYGWYSPDFEELVTIGANSRPDRPVIITETGADAVVPAQGGPAEGLFSEAYMAEVYRRQIAILRRLDYVKGISPWVLYDFRAERRQNRWQQGWNRKGLIAQDKTTRKAAFGILAAYYAELAAGSRGQAGGGRDLC